MSVDDRMPRVLIVAENASARFGGEAILPLHYFRILRARGVEAWLVVHERTRAELEAFLPAERGRMHFIPDTRLHKVLWRAGRPLPRRVDEATLGQASHLWTQLLQRRLARRLVAEHAVDVVHEPIPVSPKAPSLMHGLGAPVVMGPMNGGMEYPAAFRGRQGRSEEWTVALGRRLSGLANRALPGKVRAETLMVANDRTRRALPPGVRGRVVDLVENGVDLALWGAHRAAGPAGAAAAVADGPPRFVFTGRLIGWKGVDLLIDAFRSVADETPATLEIVGDGAIRPELEAQAARLGLSGRVSFAGWLPQRDCATRLDGAAALVLPSLWECGGAVVLEAMAMGLPVVATRWGGPADYLDESCGLLVDPDSREALVAGFRDAMIRLARDPGLGRRLGDAGRERVRREFDWERKVDRVLGVYREAIDRARAPAR